MKTDFRLDRRFVRNGFDLHEGIVCSAFGYGTRNHNLLDETQIKSSHRIETVNKIIRILMRSRVAQCAKRIKRLDRLLGFVGRIDRLRLINNNDRARSLNKFDWGAATKSAIHLLINHIRLFLILGTSEILSKRIDVYYNDLECVGRRELAQPIDALRVVDKRFCFFVVDCLEMLRHNSERMRHAFTDSDAWNNNNELLETIAL